MSTATLPALDSSLYPQVWEEQTFDSPQKFLLALLSSFLVVVKLWFSGASVGH